jgi:hypothetical protein
MIRNYEYRFEIKPGKFVYVPTEQCRNYGSKLIDRLMKKWSPEPYFYHLTKAGGHVAAMRPHLPRKFVASIDLTTFFTSVSRTRVHRALLKIGVRNRSALDIATESCVEDNGRKYLPYGFPQSMLLATLVFEKSALGSAVRELRAEGITITVYVDDILISSDDISTLQSAYDRILGSIALSGFQFSHPKSEPPNTSINSFNCRVSNEIVVLKERMDQFKEQLVNASPRAREAILRYVGVLNADQATELSL